MAFDLRNLRCCAILAVSSLVACTTASRDGEFDEDLEAFEEEALAEEEASEEEEEPAEPAPSEEPSEGEVDEDQEVPPRVPLLLEGECEDVGAASQCYVDEGAGTQYCHQGQWGPCVVGPECELGDVMVEICHFGEPTELACVLMGGVPEWEDCGFTPLVMSFDGHEPVFDAGAEAFELSDGSGTCLAREWPGAETPWLAIDLDRNGVIDNGRELFGSATPMPDGRRPADGFEALAQYDDDHDGRITPHDPVWNSLQLWSDFDRDRASSAWELLPLEHSGLASIDLGYTRDRRCDGRGNCGIERGSFAFASDAGGVATGAVIDVHIPCD